MSANPTLYVETTVIGYLTSRISRELVIAANQQVTREWWNDHCGDFDLFISQFVVQECTAGDPGAARERLEVIAGIPELDVTDEVKTLAKELVAKRSAPR